MGCATDPKEFYPQITQMTQIPIREGDGYLDQDLIL